MAAPRIGMATPRYCEKTKRMMILTRDRMDAKSRINENALAHIGICDSLDIKFETTAGRLRSTRAISWLNLQAND